MTARRGSLRHAVTRWVGQARPLDPRSNNGFQRGLQRATSIIGRTLAFVVVTLIAVMIGIQTWRVGYADYQLHKQITAIESDNRNLTAQSVTLRRELLLSRNPEYLVPLIHEQLGLAKPREVFVRLEPESIAPSP